MPVLPVGRRPGPVFGALGQTCFHGIALDVGADPVELGAVTDPMVERFVLPEGFSLAMEQTVGIARGGAFDAVSDSGQRRERVEQDVHVVGHDRVSVKCEVTKLLTAEDGGLDTAGHFRILQPVRAGGGGIELPISLDKLLAGLVRESSELGEDFGRERAVETPSEKNSVRRRVPVGQVALVVAHRRNGSTGIPACANFLAGAQDALSTISDTARKEPVRPAASSKAAHTAKIALHSLAREYHPDGYAPRKNGPTEPRPSAGASVGKKLIGALLAGILMCCVYPSFAAQKQKKGASVLRASTTLVLVPTFVYDTRLVLRPDFKKWRECSEANSRLFARLRPSQPYLPATCRQGVVRGLTARDFRLFQDGVEQKIVSVTLEDWSMVVRDSLGWHNSFSLTPAGEWSTPDLERAGFYPERREPLYLLTYVPLSGKPGSCHKIRVKVARPDTLVLARNSYCVGQTPSDPLSGTKFGKKLEAALSADRRGKFQLSMQAGVFYGSNGKALVDIALRVPWKSLHCTWNLSNGKLRATIGVLVEIRGKDGRVVARLGDLAFPSYWPTFVSGAGLVVPGGLVPRSPPEAFSQRGGPQPAGFPQPRPRDLRRLIRREPGWLPNRYETQVVLPPGSYQLQAVMSDGKHFGRAAMPLVVPDVAGQRLELSSIALCRRMRDAAAANAEAVDGHFAPQYIPLVSKTIQVALTAKPRFTEAEGPVAYFEVNDPLLSKKTTPLEVYIRVLDASTGKTVATFAPFDALPYEQSGNAVIRIAREIPVQELDPGTYRLEVRAANSVGSTPWRTADFTVTAKNPPSR